MTIQDLFSALGNQAEALSSSVSKAIAYSVKEQQFESELRSIGDRFYQQVDLNNPDNTTGTMVKSFQSTMEALQKKAKKPGITQSELSAIAISMENVSIHFRREVTPQLSNSAQLAAFDQGKLYVSQLYVTVNNNGGFYIRGLPSSTQVRETAERIAESYGGEQLGINKERLEAVIRTGIATQALESFKGDDKKDKLAAILIKLGVTEAVAKDDAARLATIKEAKDFQAKQVLTKSAGWSFIDQDLTGEETFQAAAGGVGSEAIKDILSGPNAVDYLQTQKNNPNLVGLLPIALSDRGQLAILATMDGRSKEWINNMLQAYDSGKGTAEQIDFLKSWRRNRDEFKNLGLSKKMGSQARFASEALYGWYLTKGASRGEANAQVLRHLKVITLNGEKIYQLISSKTTDEDVTNPNDVHQLYAKALYRKYPIISGKKVFIERLNDKTIIAQVVGEPDGDTYILEPRDVPTLASDARDLVSQVNVKNENDLLETMQKNGFQLFVHKGILYVPEHLRNKAIFWDGKFIGGSGDGNVDLYQSGDAPSLTLANARQRGTRLSKHILETNRRLQALADSGETVLVSSNSLNEVSPYKRRQTTGELERQEGRNLTKKELRDLREQKGILDFPKITIPTGSDEDDIRWIIPEGKTFQWALGHYNTAVRKYPDDIQKRLDYLLEFDIFGWAQGYDSNAPQSTNVGTGTITEDTRSAAINLRGLLITWRFESR